MPVEVSTHELVESASQEVGLDFDIGMRTIHAVSRVISESIAGGKGIKLPGLGAFTLASGGGGGGQQLMFQPATELTNKYKVKYNSAATPENISISPINFSLVAHYADINRDQADAFLTKLISAMGRKVLGGRIVLLSLHKVADLQFNGGNLKVTFTNSPSSSSKAAAAKSPRPFPSEQLFAAKKVEKSSKPGVPAEVVNRARNPITFENCSDVSSIPPPPRREKNNIMPTSRPSSASSTSSVRTSSTISSRPSSTASSIRAPVGRAGGGGAAASTASRTSSNAISSAPIRGQAVDARAVAARALSSADIVQKIREKVVERGGGNGIRVLSKLLMIMDDNGDKRLSLDEFRYGLRDYGIDLSPSEYQDCFAYFDRNRDGSIDITEFLVGIAGDMNPRRKRLVRMAFDILDSDKDGSVTVDEILAVYDMSWSPDVKEGKCTIQQAAKNFMKHWDRLEQDGLVTLEEFEDYYKEISASIDDDDYFELMIRNAWRISGGKGAAANTANKRVLVTHADGSQTVETVNNELGLRAGDLEGIRSRLAQQGVKAGAIGLHYGDEVGKTNARAGAAKPQLSTANNIFNFANNATPAAAVHSTATAAAAATAAAKISNESGEFSVWDTLHKAFYNPPAPIEAVAKKLMVSSFCPNIPKGAFLNRVKALVPTVQRSQLADIWKAIDPKDLGSIELNAFFDLLQEHFGKDKSNKAVSVFERCRAKILERCGGQAGIKGLQRCLSIMDDSGDKRLSKEELKFGMKDYGIELNFREIDEIFTYFDKDRNGFIDFTEFLVGIRGELNDRRKKLVRMAFDILDKDRSGVITVEEIAAVYDVSANPDVISGRKTPQQAYRDFMNQWDRHDQDGLVTLEEFEDYYKEISASIDGDDYFELMIRNAWRISGGKGAAANTANKRVLVTHADGSQTVETVNNELGLRAGDLEGIRSRLAQQGVKAGAIGLHYGDEVGKSKAKTGAARPSVGTKTAHSDAAPTRSAFDRNMAAVKVAAAFRGKLARNEFSNMKRKAEAEARAKAEEEAEANIPRPMKVIRPIVTKNRAKPRF